MYKEAINLLKQANQLDNIGKSKEASQIEKKAIQMLKTSQSIGKNPILDQFQKIINQIDAIQDQQEKFHTLQAMQYMLRPVMKQNKKQIEQPAEVQKISKGGGKPTDYLQDNKKAKEPTLLANPSKAVDWQLQ